jgi:hypothetical protein
LPKLVVVSVSGGGIRAAIWACAVLEELAITFPRIFPSCVRIVTGASGGLVGAGYYVAHRALGAANSVWVDGTARYPLARAVGIESLSPVISTMLFNDLPSIWWWKDTWPWLKNNDFRDRGCRRSLP